jgi:outer membrane protein OmpA-like peptidoglycan-associated protein
LVIEYRGEEAPLNANKSEESKKKNRRVELRLRTK